MASNAKSQARPFSARQDNAAPPPGGRVVHMLPASVAGAQPPRPAQPQPSQRPPQQQQQQQQRQQQQHQQPAAGVAVAGVSSQGASPQKKRRRRGRKGKAPAAGAAAGSDDEEDDDDAAAPAAAAASAGSAATATALGGRLVRVPQPAAVPAAPAAAAAVAAPRGPAVAPAADAVPFASLRVHVNTQRAMSQVFGYSHMTAVQAASIPVSLTGRDVLAKAKTGSGKTLAFLIPAIEQLYAPGAPAFGSGGARGVRILVVSPTRELAAQIGVEAEKLCAAGHALTVCVVFGGTNLNTDVKNLQRGVDILVATPGRLIDHLENGQAKLHDRLQSLRVLVLDEADRLLDMGFLPSLKTIFSHLPVARQTLLFSATLPAEVMGIVKQTLRAPYEFVNCVAPEDEQTVQLVEQSVCVTPVDDQLDACLAVVLSHLQQQAAKRQPSKVIFFFTTARLTQFVAALFAEDAVRVALQAANAQQPIPAWEIHSRKSQNFRTRAADEFRHSPSGLLFSSDVSARGVDYPGVTLVLQVGLTDRESYIHRLGRTARAGNSGQGVLLLADFEAPFLRVIADLPVKRINVPASPVVPSPMRTVLGYVHRSRELNDEAEMAWQSWLGFYNSHLRMLKWEKTELVQRANAFAPSLGLAEPPALQKQTIGKMGLKGVPGLRVAAAEPHQGGGGRGGGGGGNGGGRGGGFVGRGGGRS